MAQHNSKLKQSWEQLIEDNPRTRIRDAAEILNVSEMELLTINMPSDHTLLLHGDFKALMQRLTQVGKIMTLVRNDIAVHELSGTYPALRFNRNPQVGVAMDAIDLRIHFNEYCYAFAVQTPQGKQTLKSIQFFDKSGHALQKIYLKNQDHNQLWDDIVNSFKADMQLANFNLVKVEKYNQSFVDIDLPRFKKAWEQMRDVHDLSRIIKRFGISRHEAVSIIGEPYSYQIKPQSVNTFMQQVSEQKMACFVFVGNKGVTQIYSGEFQNTKEMGSWMNVLDPNFNLHVLTSTINDAWVVKKPTRFGIVTSLEIYDVNGKVSLQFAPTGTREGKESDEWRLLLEQLPKAKTKK
ncbi:hemin-degrading factor [Thiomicrorhabdus hydrogeniphila]